MKILLDENIPRKLVEAIAAEGHQVESVHTLRLAGIENGALYLLAQRDFDLFFTRDADFAKRARESRTPGKCKLLRVTLHQQPQDQFVITFMAAFRKSDWEKFRNGEDWPKQA